MRHITRVLTVLVLLAGISYAHVGTHPSVHDTVAGIIERMQREMSPEELTELNEKSVLEFMTEEEREILASEHLVFRVNVPVVVTVFREAQQRETVYWLEGRGFEKTDYRVEAGGETFEAWQKEFDPGEIGLGVNSLTGSGDHYFVGIAPRNESDTVEVTDIYPGRHTLGVVRVGERPYVGWDDRVLGEVPDALEGDVLLRGDQDKRRTARLTNIFRLTQYPATSAPDQIVLTWSGDPQNTQAIQWRTSEEGDSGAVRFRTANADWRVVAAETEPLVSYNTANDPIVHRHTAVLDGLQPGTTYEYAVGDGSQGGWSDVSTFTTAPAGTEPFKFIYMGDAQNGLDTWGNLVQKAYAEEPAAAFYVMAGDLVNRGNERDDWDSFFHNAAPVYDRRQLVPAIGNHEDQGELGPWMYLELFDLPENGPDTIPAERAYSFEYSNALFVVLDSNLPPASQAQWLEEQLAGTEATWKFVVYHHPAYSSGPRRDNPEVRGIWGALFDKYHVDLALQGHDHAYLRTWPMRDQKRVDSPSEGTIYIVSVSGTKYYDQGDFDYTEVGMTNVSTYQVLDIQIDGNQLTYKAYDGDGAVRDEFVIEK
ncbi:MAG: metallophosphoesterase family protein [Candidatus Hydrogenedentota bacterium]